MEAATLAPSTRMMEFAKLAPSTRRSQMTQAQLRLQPDSRHRCHPHHHPGFQHHHQILHQRTDNPITGNEAHKTEAGLVLADTHKHGLGGEGGERKK
jgi:hypothetical protein